MKKFVTDEYRVAFAEWINEVAEWDWWFTGTFRYECALEPAKRAFKKFMKRELGRGGRLRICLRIQSRSWWLPRSRALC